MYAGYWSKGLRDTGLGNCSVRSLVNVRERWGRRQISTGEILGYTKSEEVTGIIRYHEGKEGQRKGAAHAHWNLLDEHCGWLSPLQLAWSRMRLH